MFSSENWNGVESWACPCRAPALPAKDSTIWAIVIPVKVGMLDFIHSFILSLF